MKKEKQHALIFVYNADSGFFNSLSDFAHKIISPKTYNCSLCKLSYGNFSEKGEWKKFVSSFKIKSLFFHKDEFETAYSIKNKNYPAVFWQNGFEITEIILPDEINSCSATSELINLVKKKFTYYGIH